MDLKQLSGSDVASEVWFQRFARQRSSQDRTGGIVWEVEIAVDRLVRFRYVDTCLVYLQQELGNHVFPAVGGKETTV